MKKDEYPLLHIYAQRSDRPIQIIGNTEGLLTLAVAIIEATSIQGEGRAEVFCADAYSYEISVLRDDSESAWEILELPYNPHSAPPTVTRGTTGPPLPD